MTNDLMPLDDSATSGIRLLTSLGNRTAERNGTTPWSRLDLAITLREELNRAELLAEMRVSRGTAWVKDWTLERLGAAAPE
ncbi:MAG: hypothetical protein SGJ09_10270 [Phycisphaerae bacterium]|nr:hypothetical protein [Phycisphaerae bacterium]